MKKNRKFYKCKKCGREFSEIKDNKKCDNCGGDMQSVHIIHPDNTDETEIRNDIK